MELSSSATSEGLDNAIHSDVRPQLSVGSGQRKRRLEFSDLSMQRQAPTAKEPCEEEQQILGRVDERMSVAERQPSPQQDKHYATLVAGVKEALRTIRKLEKPYDDYAFLDGSLERLAARFAAVLARGDPPPETDLVSVFPSRIPFRLVRLVCHQHFDRWIAAKDALHQTLAPEECARELWLVYAPLERVRGEKAARSFLQQPHRHRQAYKPQHTFTGLTGSTSAHSKTAKVEKRQGLGSFRGLDPRPAKSERGIDSNCCRLMRASNTSSQEKCALCDASHQIVTSHLGWPQPRTAASQQIPQCAADLKKQNRSAESSPSHAEHSKDCKPELMVNQHASRAGRSIIASAVPSELKNPQQAWKNAFATNCSYFWTRSCT
ncbi:hypothetical protein Esti_006645 [Eimeria stiedai]